MGRRGPSLLPLFLSSARVAAMSAKQIVILTATVVGLVVIVTLAKVYLGGFGTKDKPPPPVEVLDKPHLDFAHRSPTGGTWVVLNAPSPFSDPKRPSPPEDEVGAEGHYDYSFKNERESEVTLYLTKLSCNRCLHLQVALAPEGWQESQASQAAQAVAAGFGPAGGVSGAAQAAAGKPAPGADVAWETLEPQDLNPKAKGFAVPPKRAGWARLVWKDVEAGDQRHTANLRTTCADNSSAPPVVLEHWAVFIEPVRVLPESKLLVLTDKLTIGDKPREAWFVVYSSTRPALKLEPEPDDEQKKHPFALCGKPIPLSRPECDQLQKESRRAVLCAYKVPVTVYERLDDGREHDLGPFRWTVALKADVTEAAIGLTVGGTLVSPDITVLANSENRSEDDRVAFGTFPRSSGATKKVTIEVPLGTSLKIDDKVKVPEFLKAQVEADEVRKGARRQTWSLTVSVKPDSVSGHFPNPDDPTLRDTAIYVMAKDRRVRIPVSGTASQR
jgi:hypothetical protein